MSFHSLYIPNEKLIAHMSKRYHFFVDSVMQGYKYDSECIVSERIISCPQHKMVANGNTILIHQSVLCKCAIQICIVGCTRIIKIVKSGLHCKVSLV